MQGIQVLLTPFVWILMFFYNLFSNYGLALILFAVLVKLILFPFSLKGKRGMIQTTALQGKMQKLQKMYGNNKEKYNLEVQKLYEKEKVNPMGGCVWMMLPMLVLLPLYAIIRQPMTYMMNLGPEAIQQIALALNWDSVALNMGWINQGTIDAAIQAAQKAGESFVSSFQNAGYNQLYLASLITPDTLGGVKDAVSSGAASLFSINFDFLGLNLAQMPTWKFWTNGLDWGTIGLSIMPVVSAGSSLLMSFITVKTNAINKQAAPTGGANNMMMYLMSPLMSLWIGYSMPAGLSIYWIAQSLISIVQEIAASKILKKDYEKAAQASAKREEEEREEEKRQKEAERVERARRIEDQKSGKTKKISAKKAEDDKIPTSVKEASRVGIRTYARGRAYDPLRFGSDGPTPYGEQHVPALRQTEAEEDLKDQAEELEQVALEKAADDVIVEEILEEQAADEADESQQSEEK